MTKTLMELFLGWRETRPAKSVPEAPVEKPVLNTMLAVMRCARTTAGYTMTFTRTTSGWHATATNPLNEAATKREGFGQQNVAGLFITDYRVTCPHCRAGSFFQCGACRRLTCWNGVDRTITCAWCKNSSGMGNGCITNFTMAADA